MSRSRTLSLFSAGVAVAIASCRIGTGGSQLRDDGDIVGETTRGQMALSGDPQSGRVWLELAQSQQTIAQLRDGVAYVLRFDVVPADSGDPVQCGALANEKQLTKADFLVGASGRVELGKIDPARFVSVLNRDSDKAGLMKAAQASFEQYKAPPRVQGCLIEGGATKAVASNEPVRQGGLALAGEAFALSDYAKRCQEEVGALPTFNCLDGAIIPITVDGVEQAEPVARCDKPVWLGIGAGGQCKPFARIQMVPNPNAAVQTAVVCRRYSSTTKDSPMFEDVAVVHHNTENGATCFFQMLDYDKKDATRVPSPMDTFSDDRVTADRAKDFWLPFENLQVQGMQCTRCHGNDPFMHSPYIDQANVVPYQAGHEFGPYKIVAADELGWTLPRALTSAKVQIGGALKENRCLSCHRISELNTCQSWVTQSTDHEALGAGEHGAAWRNATDSGRKIGGKSNPWMPPPTAATATVEKWRQAMDPHVARIKECCSNPSAPGCVWEDHITR